MLAVLGVICFAICTEADTYLEACAIGDNKNMKTERRITFQRGDFIRFSSKNDIVVGSIEIYLCSYCKGKRETTYRGQCSGQWEPRDSLLVYWYWRTRYLEMGTGNARAGDKFV